MDTDAGKAAGADWWAQDFSWDGLAGKPWHGWSAGPDGRVAESVAAPEGSRPASLQDYFRRDAAGDALREDAALIASGLLQRAPDGTLFHILHLPVHWQDGSPSWKADPQAPDQTRLEAGLLGWLNAARESEFNGTWRPAGADRRARLDGGVIRALPPVPVLHVRARHLWVPGDLDLSATRFGPEADFTGAVFGGQIRFCRASFAGTAIFDRVNFHAAADFAGAAFAGHGDFMQARFAGTASFCGAVFDGRADFESARFGGATDFSDIAVNDLADFLDARFHGPAGFAAAHFNDEADFINARFHAKADFTAARFGGRHDFSGVRFEGGVEGLPDA